VAAALLPAPAAWASSLASPLPAGADEPIAKLAKSKAEWRTLLSRNY